MPWWGWIAVGALLLVAEMTIVDLEFYLVFLGISALLVGLLELGGLDLAPWVQWLVFAALAVASLVIFRQRIYVMLRPPAEGVVREGVEGDRAIAVADIAQGATGQVTLRGAGWNAINRGNCDIPRGAACRVLRSEGLRLDVELEN